jgi:hypothetical protein
MSDLKRELHRYIDGLEEPVSIQEAMERASRQRRFQVPAAVLAGAAVVLIPALVLVGLRLLPGNDGEVADTTMPTTVTTVIEDTTTTAVETTTNSPAVANVVVPDLNGLTVAAAREILDDLGLELEIAEQQPSRTGFGLITAQGPLAGEEAATGSTVAVGVRVEAECLSASSVPFDTAPGNVAATVLFGCAQESMFPDISTAVVREVADPGSPIEATLRALLAGLTDEQREMGFSSFFSEESANALNSIALSGDRLVVDFNDDILIGNASTSTGSLFLMAELQANIFQFENVNSIEFRLNGSCDAFWGWLQGSCEIVTRTSWEERVAAWDAERALLPEPGQEIRIDDIVGQTFTTRSGEAGQEILTYEEIQAYSGFWKIEGWLVDDPDSAGPTDWALHVTGLNEDMIWLVDSSERTDDGPLVFEVKAVLTIPWDEIEFAADPFVVSGAKACTVGGDLDPTVIVAAQIAENSDGSIAETMQNLRAWRIDVEDGAFKEIGTAGIECLFEYA